MGAGRGKKPANPWVWARLYGPSGQALKSTHLLQLKDWQSQVGGQLCLTTVLSNVFDLKNFTNTPFVYSIEFAILGFYLYD